MKRKLSALAAVLFLITITACAAWAQEEQTAGTSYDLEEAGVSFDLPKQLQNLKGILQPAYGTEVEDGSGIYLSGLVYAAFSEEKYQELAAKGENLTEEDYTFIDDRVFEILLVYTIDDGRTLEDVQDTLEQYGLPTEGAEQFAAEGEYNFYSLPDPLADVAETEITFDEGFREDYETAREICRDPSWIRVYEPVSSTTESGTGIHFETTDLDGNPVDSADIFGNAKITMVNLWGTYCGPCINEMPGLEELNQRLAEKDCAIIGIVVDIRNPEDTGLIETAKEIIEDTGVTYPNLLPWDGLDITLRAQFIPTTYFIDANGKLVGEAAVGARGADEYEALLDEALESINEQ